MIRTLQLWLFSHHSRGIRILIWVFLLSTSPLTVRADILSVDQGNPECNDATGEPFCTIASAVSNAADGDEIEVAAGTYVETMTVPQMIAIRGAGADVTIVDGAGQGRVFDLLGSTSLEGLTITGGSQMTFGGGGIRTFGDTLVADCVVTNNAGAGGGGIKQEGGTLLVLRTTVSRNTSDALNVAGGAGIWTRSGELTIVDSRIADNRNLHSESPGGGLKIDSGDTLIIRTTVEGNTSQNNGGGITTTGESLTLIDSTVSNNEAALGRGGVGSIVSDITLINTTVSGNRARTGAGVSSTACCGAQPLLTLQNVTVFDNESTSNGTGGVTIGADSAVSNSILAGNINADGPSDCSGFLDSLGYNLIQGTGCTILGDLTGNQLGIDPLLLPLNDNGGPTQTHALTGDSPALEAGNPATPGSMDEACEATDQRGAKRPQDGDIDGRGICDIGAYEFVSMIFEDSFESGDMSAWSNVVGAG